MDSNHWAAVLIYICASFSVTAFLALSMVHVMNAFDTSYASAAMSSTVYTVGLLDVWWTV